MIFDLSSFIPGLSFILYVIFTVFSLNKKKDEKLHWPFILYMFLMSVWSFGSFMMHANTKVLTPLNWNRIMVAGMLGVPITIFHSVMDLFKKKGARYNILLYIGYTIYGFLIVLNFMGAIVTNAWFEGDRFFYTLGNGTFIAYVLSYSFLIIGIIILSRELYRTHDELIKKKLRLPLIGGCVMLMGVLVNLYQPLGRYPIDLFTSTINAFIIFYAIYKYRLVHYSALGMRGILHFVLVIIAALTFYGILWVSSKMMRQMPFQHSFLLSLFLGVVAAVIFQPLRTGTLPIIEKLYFGKRLDFYTSLKNFSESLTTVVELELLGKSTVNKLMETFNLDWVAMMVLEHSARAYKQVAGIGITGSEEEAIDITVKRNDPIVKTVMKHAGPFFAPNKEDEITFEIGEGTSSLRPGLVLSLKFKEKLNGFICLGKRRDKEYFNQFDLEILNILTGQCSVALENALSFEKLNRQQKKLQNMNREIIISRNKLEAFFDGITTPISIQDINYNIVTVNFAATRYFKTSFNALLGRKCYKVFFDRNKPCENCMAQDSMHAGLPFGIEVTDSKTRMVFSIHFYPISVPDGSKKIFLEFFQDVTQEKRLRRELIQSEKLAGIGTLASGIAHEINNPLYGIIGTAEIMLEDGPSAVKFKEYTKDIIDYAQNAAEIIKDLTNYSRTGERVNTPIDICEVIDTSLKLAKRGMNFDEIKVEKKYEDTPMIEAHSNELQQVFLNLVINAVQAMNGEGTLLINVRSQKGNVMISISDTGGGINEQDMDNVFNPFFTTKEPGKGTGLGLSIVYQIIHNMGGRANVESEVGLGTTFYLLIPLTAAETKKISFVHAQKPDEIEDVFFLQRKILVGEKGYLEETIRRKVDEDSYHIVAYKGIQPVGTVSIMPETREPNLPIEDHFKLDFHKKDRRCVEIDRLAVLKEDRRGVIPLSLMTLAYLYARSEQAERVFLDVFADEKKYIKMYKKLGFQKIGEYMWPLPVTVMMMGQKPPYEKTGKRLEDFVKPFMTKLVKRITFEDRERKRFLNTIENITKLSRKNRVEEKQGI